MDKKLYQFIQDRFYEKGETPAGFSNNSIYSQQAVDQTMKGIIQSVRIRKDMARYLGYQDWNDMVSEYEQAVEA